MWMLLGADDRLRGVERDEVEELAVEADWIVIHHQVVQPKMVAGDGADIGEGGDGLVSRLRVIALQHKVGARHQQQHHAILHHRRVGSNTPPDRPRHLQCPQSARGEPPQRHSTPGGRCVVLPAGYRRLGSGLVRWLILFARDATSHRLPSSPDPVSISHISHIPACYQGALPRWAQNAMILLWSI